jgi:AcrR family transcriptional regulator
MRVRTEQKRQDILAAARKVFLEQGFDGASMDAIARAVGGSKATLYGYFPAKEDLAIACLREAAAEEGANAERFVDEADELRAGLEKFGLWRLQTTLTPGGLFVRRMIWAEAGPTILRKLFGEIDATNTTWGRLAARLKRAMERDELRRADPLTAAQHFRGLLETDISDRYFFGFPSTVDDALMRKTAKEATDAFMRAYAPDEAKRPARRK